MSSFESENTISLWEENSRKGITLKNIQTGKKYTFYIRHSFIVGRTAAQCDMQITTDDRYMSGRHLRFVYENGRISVEDLHTKNGTRLNGKIITQKTRIRKGDILKMGRSEFSVTFS